MHIVELQIHTIQQYFLSIVERMILFIHSKVYRIVYPLSHVHGISVNKKIPKCSPTPIVSCR